MGRVLVRKWAWLIILLPLLHIAGFYYAERVYPRFVSAIGDVAGASGSLTGGPSSSANLPFWDSYRAYVEQVLDGDLGSVAGRPLLDQLGRPLLNSAVLIVLAFALTLLLGVPLGIAALSRRTGRVGAVATVLLTAGSSLPSYLFAAVTITLVISAFRNGLPWMRDTLPWQGFGFDQHLILPVLALASRPIFYLARIVAGLLEDEMQHDYVRTARSKGVPWRGLLRDHALPNIVGPTTVALGQSVRILSSQLIVVEALFAWPGLGRMLLLALGIRVDGGPPSPFSGDPAVLATLAVLVGLLLLGSDAIASMLAYRADPRLRYPAAEQAVA